MFKLDNAFLEELGLGSLPPVEKNKMLAHIYETLEMRVGMRLAEQMTNEQLDEFEKYINAQDEAGALKWLETNFPNYKQVVAEELEKLKAEISQVATQIVAQSQENAALEAAAPPTPQQEPEPTIQTAQMPNHAPQYPNQPAGPQPSLSPYPQTPPEPQNPVSPQQPWQPPTEQ